MVVHKMREKRPVLDLQFLGFVDKLHAYLKPAHCLGACHAQAAVS